MSQKRDEFIRKKIESMSLAEKVGQLLTFTRRGTMLTPSGIEQITKLQCGGLCLYLPLQPLKSLDYRFLFLRL